VTGGEVSTGMPEITTPTLGAAEPYLWIAWTPAPCVFVGFGRVR